MPLYVFKCDLCDKEIEFNITFRESQALKGESHSTVEKCDCEGKLIKQVTAHAYTPDQWRVDK